MGYRFALAGNQNSGKTTLFNRLTGSNQHVGNWPGVTVEQRSGALLPRYCGTRSTPTISVVDLPGIYSLSPFSIEERVSRDYLVRDRPDAIINCLDATNLERSLYLTLQLLEAGRPVVLALNMMDEVRKRGDAVDCAALERRLGTPVVPICARNGEGLDELIRRSIAAAEAGKAPLPPDVCHGDAAQALRSIERLIEPRAREMGMPSRYVASRLLEGDAPMLKRLALDQAATRTVEHSLRSLEQSSGMERAAVMADQRYRFIEGLTHACVRRSRTAKAGLTERLDRVLTHPLLAIPLLLLLVLTVFVVTFGPIGAAIAGWFGGLVDNGVALIANALVNWNVAEGAQNLLVDGVLRGVGSVLRFLPTILLLFLLLSILEDSGYMARAAFLMDKPLRALGLNGRSFIPLLMGFGCTVPAVMSARSMSTRRDRRFTIMLTPLMSCGAKVPIYAVFASAFFPHRQALVMACFYGCGILLAILAGRTLKRTVFLGEAAPFLMELPRYRLPTPRNVARQLWDKAEDFLKRAFTVIFLATLLVWFLQSFTFRLAPADGLETSMLGQIAGVVAPVFAPAGFGSVPAATAVLTGLLAKESVVSTLAVLSGAEASGVAMDAALRSIFPTALSAVSFLLFVLLYMPCVAAFAAMRREMESDRVARLTVLAQTGLAWAVATIVYQLGRILGLG